MLIFDDSCEWICKLKDFVDIATAGRHRELSTFYVEQDVFLSSKFGQDVELQNTQIVLFKTPHDLMQASL